MPYANFRAYLKPAGSNPEIDGLYYELSSRERFKGSWNCNMLTIGFEKDRFCSQLFFQPHDPEKPIVFAIHDLRDECYFVVVDSHLDPQKPDGGMINYSSFKTNEYIIACQDGSDIDARDKKYWSITSKGLTFVHGRGSFPNTWKIHDCDLLCAFVGGGLTANELRAQAYRVEREAKKEEKRQAHIERLSGEISQLKGELSVAEIIISVHQDAIRGLFRGHLELAIQLLDLIRGRWFPFVFVRKSKINNAIMDSIRQS